jgi:HSP20 family molecular chaperone IbpA
MDHNMMNSLRQLGQMGEQLQKMFGEDFMKRVMPNPANMSNVPNSPNIPGMGPDFSQFQNMWNWQDSKNPRTDLYQTRNELIAVFEIPGLERSSDVKVGVEPYRLYVRGQYSIRYSGVAEDQFHLTERQRGAFERDIPLPVRVIANKARASYRQGLLEVRMIKDEGSKGIGKNNYLSIDFE